MIPMFQTIRLFANKEQNKIASEITLYLHTITKRDEEPIDSSDACRASLVAAAKFNMHTIYSKRSITKEDKELLMQQFSDILDCQINSNFNEQVYSH